MKKFLLLIPFIVISYLSGCSEPCDKAQKKAESCYKKAKGKPKNNEKAAFLELCKINKSKFKKCLSIKDCKKYSECISKASTDPKAVAEIQKRKIEEGEEVAPAPAMAPAPAIKEAPMAETKNPATMGSDMK